MTLRVVTLCSAARLKISPLWQDECVVFDAASCNTYAVPKLSAQILEMLQAEKALKTSTILARINAKGDLDEQELIRVLDITLEEFQRLGLIEIIAS